MYKRIFNSIIYRIKQTSLLFIVMFVISCLLCLSFSLNYASKELIKQVKNSTKSRVAIDTDISTGFNRKLYLYDSDEYVSLSDSTYSDLNKIYEDFNIKYMDINMLYSNYGIIKSYSDDYGILISINDNELKLIDDGENIADVLNMIITSFNKYLNNEYDYWQSFDLISTRNAQFADLYYGYKLKSFGGAESNKTVIGEGRTFNEKEIDIGEYVCVITPNTYYYKDGMFTKIEVDDYIEYSMMSIKDGEPYIYKTYKFKVIGILNQDKINVNNDTIMTSGAIIPEKLFLEMYKEAEKIIDENSLNNINYSYFYPTIITLSDYDEAERLVEYLNELNNLEDKNYIYESSLDAYYALAGNLEALSENTDILFKFSITVSILLFIFIINMDLNRRKKEIGLLSLFGENKFQLIIEFSLQYLFVALISLILAILVSIFISKYYLNDLVNISNVDISIMEDKLLDYSYSLNIIKNTSISIDFLDAIIITLIEFITIIIITIFSMLRITSIKVREVLIDE